MLLRLAVPDRLQPRARWQGLTGAARPLALAEAAAAARGPLLVFTHDAAQLERLEAELAFFVPRDLPVLAFPDYETLPYDRFSPHPDIISQRLRTLARLPMLAARHRARGSADGAAAPAAAQFHRRACAHAREPARNSISRRSDCG